MSVFLMHAMHATMLDADKIDPGLLAKQVSKRSAKEAAENSFEMIAREWYTKFSTKWSPSHGERILTPIRKRHFSVAW